MALINCPDCDREVSSAAPSCPGCGAPIAGAAESRATGANITTVQETSKRLKLQMLMSVLLICGGVVWVIAASQSLQPTIVTSVGPTLMIVTGLCWYAISRFRIWWHHK
jgi:hypothetical protein